MTNLFESIEIAFRNFFVGIVLDLAIWRVCGKRNWYDARKIPLLPIWLVTGKFSRRKKETTKIFVASHVPALEKQL